MRTLFLAGLALAASVACFACGDSDDDKGGGAGSSGAANAGGSAGSSGASMGGSGGGATGSCTADSPAPGAPKGSCLMSGVLCQDYTGSGWTSDLMSQACTAISGTISDAACDTSAALGSCQVYCGSAQELVQHVMTAGQGKEDCEAMKGKYLTP